MSLLELPRSSDLARGVHATTHLVKTQWSTTRSFSSRLLMCLVIVGSGIFLFLASLIGYFVKSLAMGSMNTSEEISVAQQYALTYLAAFNRGELGAIGSGALGLCVLSAVTSPFTGSASTSIIPPRDLDGMSVTRWHRLWDSLVGQAMSSVSLLQLFTLTALTSMLTLDGGRSAGLVFTWATWIALVCLSVLSLWAAEYLYRSFGRKSRFVILSTLGALLGVGLLLDPQHGATLFGAGSWYARTVTAMGSYGGGQQALTLFTLLAFSALLFYGASLFAARSLNLREQILDRKKAEVYRGTFAIKKNTLIALLLRSILRAPEVKKPIISGVLIGIIMTVVVPTSFAIGSTFAVIVPLVVALAWGSNVFSHIGSGSVWLMSQPKALLRLPWTLLGIQMLLSAVLFCIIWTPAFLIGRVSAQSLLTNALAVLASSVVVLRSATSKSIKEPSPAHYGSRGAATLSPTKALKYTLRFALSGGVSGIVILSLNNNLVRVIIVFGIIIWQLVRMYNLAEYWHNPLHRRNTATIVSDE